MMQTTRSIAENTMAVSTDDDTAADDTADNISMPVNATDMSVPTDTLTYTLAGRDAAMFRVRQDNPNTPDANEGGQIEVGAGTMLDYEKKNSYMVMVTATDPSLASATIDVTINVMDEDEPPDFTTDGPFKKDIRENPSSLRIETFRATDPDRPQRTVYWELAQAAVTVEAVEVASTEDAADFAHLEIDPKSGILSFTSSPNYERPRDQARDASNPSVYKVLVIAADDVLDVDTRKKSYKKVIVTVTDMDETGKVTFSVRQPKVAEPLTATLNDDDVGTAPSALSWKWYKGSSLIPNENNGDYAPAVGDVSNRLKAEATYRDSDGVEEKVSATTPFVVIESTDNSNQAPTLDGEGSISVPEDTLPNKSIGKRYKATDSNSNDTPSYSLDGTDQASFTIHPTNGQITTKAKLDYETNPSYTVDVQATDRRGQDSTALTVTITITDVNEAPTITGGLTRKIHTEDDASVDSDDTDVLTVARYMATDQESAEGADECIPTNCTWELTGPDARHFKIEKEDASTFGQLSFKEKPNYEAPVDSGRNNVYEINVIATDSTGKKSAPRNVTVIVTDVEELGMVTLSSVQPKVAIELTASLKDSDGGVENITWQWELDGKDSPSSPCSAVDGEDWAEIDGAEMATYTPVTSPITDVGKCLRATAKYTDRRGDGNDAMGVSANAVIENTDNRAPMFPDTETGMRSVPENTETDMPIGDGIDDDDETNEPVVATDPNNDDNLTYTLGGVDAASFGIERGNADDGVGGQLKTKAKLDYEAKKTYMVTVTAADPNGLNDTIDVTIMVTDVDEAPEIITGGLVVRGTSDINYIENGMGMVATYSAAGPDAADATWSLSGADAGDLSISSAGVLTFMDSPNYESPADANTDNIYMVMVNANDGTNDAMKTVSVRVTNKGRDG